MMAENLEMSTSTTASPGSGLQEAGSEKEDAGVGLDEELGIGVIHSLISGYGNLYSAAFMNMRTTVNSSFHA
jgi:hypothetical protein